MNTRFLARRRIHIDVKSTIIHAHRQTPFVHAGGRLGYSSRSNRLARGAGRYRALATSPARAQNLPTWSLDPPSVTIEPNGTASTVFTVQSTANTQAASIGSFG
jgi:hypothetical protein